MVSGVIVPPSCSIQGVCAAFHVGMLFTAHFSRQPVFTSGLFFFLLTETTVCVTLSAETEVVLFMLPQTTSDVNQKEERNFLWRLYMEFGQRLKNLRLKQKKTQQDLASSVGVSAVAVRSWEHGNKKPSMDTLIALGAALGTSIDDLLGIAGDFQPAGVILSPIEKNLLDSYQALDQHGRRAVDAICAIEKERMDALLKASQPKVINIKEAVRVRERYVPHYTTPSAAGFNVPLDGADFEMMLVDDTVPEDADYAVDIDGSSMEPYIHDGDMVFVKKDTDLMIGDVGIFCVDGAMYCKQYFIDDDRNLILVSANPALRHTNVFVPVDSGSSVTTCGKVLLDCKLELPDYLFEEE